MKTKELREKSSEELHDLQIERKKELLKIRSDYRVKAQGMKRHLFKQYRKDIARSKTILSERSR